MNIEKLELLKKQGWVSVTEDCHCNYGDKFLILVGSPTITVNAGGRAAVCNNSPATIIHVK